MLEISFLTAGFFAECPKCGAENEVKKEKTGEMDSFGEVENWEEEDALPKT